MEKESLGPHIQKPLFFQIDPHEPNVASTQIISHILEDLSKLLSPSVPLSSIALLFPDGLLSGCWDGSFHTQHIELSCPWESEPCVQMEAQAAAVAPGQHFACIPLYGQAGPLAHALALFGKTTGPWTPSDRAKLAPVRSLLELYCSWRDWSRESAYQIWALNQITDTMSAGLYVTDTETDQILFMNKTMRSMFNEPEPVGKICWEVLQKGMTQRCSFCPVPLLQESKQAHPSCIWEETNTRTGRIFENHDTLMMWLDGRKVHVQQSMDVTEARRLYQAASIDDLTGLLNRRAGRNALREQLYLARTENRTVTVCMLDIDELKTINALHGRQKGDALVLALSRVLSSALSQHDCLFRLGGDEFLISIYGVSLGEANQRMRQVQQALDHAFPLPASFCYGLLELPPDHILSMTDILGAVDERLYEQKRLEHIRRAERHLLDFPQSLTQEAFDYDQSLLYNALVQSTDDYIYICNMKTNTFRYPRAMVEEFGLPSEVISHAAAVWGAHIHSDDKTSFLESNQEIADGRTDSHCVEYRAKNRKGEWVWLRCRGHIERDEHGKPALFAGFITNLDKKNRIDRLTGLLNKLEFESELERLLDCGQPATILIFGIDDLKHINNLHDRTFGDEVIRIASQKLQSMLPTNACVFRLDGDEFGVLIRGTGVELSQAFYRRVQAAFRHQQTYDGKRFFCTLSCGCVFSPRDGVRCQELVKYAHLSLESAKQHGKNQLCFFSRELLLDRERQLALTELLRESVENGFEGFELYFQPIVHGSSTELCGAEALCRWSCSQFGAVSPVEFIPILEQSGLILPVGRWIFRQAVETCARWQKTKSDFTMSVNLSNLQLEDPTFIGFMEKTLSESGVNPAQVVVELTESYLASHVSALSDYLVRLRRMQVRIAMDDFGTGYSSLGVLKQYPIDIVKIDRTFVKGIQSSAFDRAFIQFVVDLCHKLEIKVLLEGVETLETLDVVHPMKLNYYQGFYFGKPTPQEAFAKQFLQP